MQIVSHAIKETGIVTRVRTIVFDCFRALVFETLRGHRWGKIKLVARKLKRKKKWRCRFYAFSSFYSELHHLAALDRNNILRQMMDLKALFSVADYEYMHLFFRVCSYFS